MNEEDDDDSCILCGEALDTDGFCPDCDDVDEDDEFSRGLDFDD